MIKDKIYSFKDTVVNNPSFTLKEQLGYAGGIFGNCMGQDSVGTFSNKFFRNFMGLDSGKVTIIDNVQSVCDFIANPIAGNFLDKPTTLGKKSASKKILGIMPIPFAVSSMLLFLVPTANPLYNFIWAVLFKSLFGIVDAFYDMALNTMSLRMTTNDKDRKNFYTVSTLASSLGSMLPGWIIPIIVGTTDDATRQKWLYFFIALVFCILGVSAMYAPYMTLNEKVSVAHSDNSSAISWNKQTVTSVLHNRTFLIVQAGNFFEKIRSCSYELLIYIYDDVFDNYGMKAAVDAISGGLSYAGLAAVPFITNKFSARTVMSMGYGFTGFFYLLMSFFALGFKVEKIRKYRWIIGICIGIAGMPNNAISASKKVVVGDSTDYMEWYSAKKYGVPIRAEGLICSVQGICTTCFKFIVQNIYNPLFGVIGYEESTVTKGSEKAIQSDSTLKGLYLMFVLFGVIGNFLASIVYRFDNYTGKRKEEILNELREIRTNNNVNNTDR